jgi:hypothetical protein
VRLAIARHRAIVGIDVGENYLDLAIIDADRRRLEHSRIDLREIGGADPIGELASRFARCLGASGSRAIARSIAIIDSPRSPLDADGMTFAPILDPMASRAIDAGLREIVRALNRNPNRAPKLRLSLFPSRPTKYFVDCAFHPDCKPHLGAFGSRLFARPTTMIPASPLSGGALFTRFMIAGFATYRALEQLGVEAYEGYPYLAFSLWRKNHEDLPPKNRANVALPARNLILQRLAARFSDLATPSANSLDQADAAILAITTVLAIAERNALLVIHAPHEGRFLIALDRLDSDFLELDCVPLGHSASLGKVRLTTMEANGLKEN